MSDYGSNKPLNKHVTILPEAKIFKAISAEDRVAEEARAGTPPTSRWGGVNGSPTNWMLPVTPQNNPQLYLGKAMPPTMPTMPMPKPPMPMARSIAPTEEEVEVAKAFAKALGIPSIPQQQQQAPNLANPKPNPMMQAPGMGAGMSGSPPGMAGMAQGAGIKQGIGNDPSQQTRGQGLPAIPPMGTTQSGMPIYDDPYHPEHANFGPQEHSEAANLHMQQSDMATSSGRIPNALDHQMKARIHGDLAEDNQSPMERMNSRNHPYPEGDPMDQFINQMPQASPNNNPGNGSPDQQKPIFNDPSMQQGPKPGMYNTDTNSPVGMQTNHPQHAGTVSKPQGMPPVGNGTDEPIPGNESQESDYAQAGNGPSTEEKSPAFKKESAPTGSYGGNATEDKSDQEQSYGKKFGKGNWLADLLG